MRLSKTEILVPTTADTDILDLTPEVARYVAEVGARSGWVLLFVPGSTAAITSIEFEGGCLEDLRTAVERLAPRDGEYAHNLKWGDGNGYSHVRAALLGPSLTIPIHDGALAIGTWQQLVLCDFDNRPRRRRVLLEIFGE